ncbi:phosphoenolpyruvate--protein phosphotransferase [Salinicoccus hispanicus]|uniref:Phosphoenolpyruvate-protein phosphotransferase n=1 Tax=Salinicoccus hispanicus TaxID=157225 RepID=A0A6N8TWE5_9STAP|nr:phosphoenolpyruvate--protein phosphotransferase [Salinicoccus hispanicus]MXQ49732.1 phosphoenolpyruvate--protein phosphotransferase [Salinicoccus hispanicus]
MSKILKGIGASDGVAIAPVYSLEEPDLSFDNKSIDAGQEDAEVERFKAAFNQSKVEITRIRNHAEESVGPEHAAIFDAHLLVLDDPEFLGPIESHICNDQKSAPQALLETRDQFVAIFENMDNEYMQERAADIKDVSKRVLAHMLGKELPDPSKIDTPVVIVAEDLTPSDTAQLDKNFVKGFVTNVGGRTSHSAIMSRSLEIPAVVGTKEITELANVGDHIIVDGSAGEVIINPTEEEVLVYQDKEAKVQEEKAELQKLVDEPSKTMDGISVELAANIGTPDDLDGVKSNGAEGIGLYRTEFLYMGRNELPTEDEQYEAYKKVLKDMGDKPVVVRTIDIGGDKELPYMDLPKEMNPFLGYRAIRMALDNQDLFRTQLRALLRAGQHGNLKIMFPMIATIDEFNRAKAMLIEEKDKLVDEGEKVKEDIEVGIMIEIPSAAIIADQFAKVVDFFSIGTNDLIQYTMAADRMNESVSYLYQPHHPALLRLIKMVIDAAHKEGKWAGMCGEMAGDAHAVPLLVGLGLDEFSMSASSILKARKQISELKKTDMERLAQAAVECSSTEEVLALVEEYTQRA